jgi:ribosome-associated protein
MEFKLRSEFVELDNMLKAAGLVTSGAEARQIISGGLVKVNGQAETRIRRKLRPGDSVEFKEQQVSIIT